MARKRIGKDKGWHLSEDAESDHLAKVSAANKARVAEEMEAAKECELQSAFLESLRDKVEVDEFELDNLEQFPLLTSTKKPIAKAKQKTQEHKVNQTSKQANQQTCARAHTHTQTNTNTHTRKHIAQIQIQAHTQAALQVEIVVTRNLNNGINGVWEALVGKPLGQGFLMEGRLSDAKFLKVHLTSTCTSTPHTTTHNTQLHTREHTRT